jgi:hypothetical protein
MDEVRPGWIWNNHLRDTIMLWKPTFKFSRGPMKNQVTSERMNHILDGVKMAQPSASGHVGMTINQTSDGWVAKVLTKKPTLVQIGLTLWELYQEDAGTNPLQVSMRSGVCVNTNTTSLYPTNSVINWTTANVTASQTTIFWLKVSVAKATYQTYYEVWGVTAMVVQTGTTLPTDTLDIPTDTDGDLHFQIGTVTADGTEVTGIVQDLSYPVTVVFPLGVIIGEPECPV